MQKLSIFLIILGVNSCSHSPVNVKNLTGVERVEIDQSEYVRPQFYIDQFEFSKNKREIASVEIEYDETDITNRQLYFLTYYQQYLTLGRILKKENTIKSCPSFHHIYLEYKDQLEVRSNQYTTKFNFNPVKRNGYLVTQYPVMALPYSQKNDLYSVLISKNWDEAGEHFQHALEYYYELEREELATLCDRGVSPGYYVYENLVQYFQQRSDFHKSQEGLKAILKIPVVANMLILDNLISENYAMNKSTNFENWLITRSNLAWFKEYRESLVKNRKVLLSAKY